MSLTESLYAAGPQDRDAELTAVPAAPGTHFCLVDAKGRVVIPAAYQSRFPNGAVLVPALTESYRCILVLTPAQWGRAWRQWGDEFAWWQRFGSLAARVEMDPGNRRVLIPHALRDLFGIRPADTLVFRPVGDLLELLDEGTWRRTLRERAEDVWYG